MLFFYSISTSSASADNNESNDSEHNNEDCALPDYGPQIFEKAKKNPSVVAVRGTMPIITDASEKMEWTDSLVQCSQSLGNPYNTDKGIMSYFVEFGGPVSSFGTDINGYLAVGFEGYSSEIVNESLINEIYQVIDEGCEKEGISDVPVVFEFEGYDIEEDSAIDDGTTNEDYSKLSINQEETASKETTTQSPGFTSIMVILGVLSSVIVKR
jgi:hypothetical protein